MEIMYYNIAVVSCLFSFILLLALIKVLRVSKKNKDSADGLLLVIKVLKKSRSDLQDSFILAEKKIDVLTTTKNNLVIQLDNSKEEIGVLIGKYKNKDRKYNKAKRHIETLETQILRKIK